MMERTSESDKVLGHSGIGGTGRARQIPGSNLGPNSGQIKNLREELIGTSSQLGASLVEIRDSVERKHQHGADVNKLFSTTFHQEYSPWPTIIL